MENTIMKKITFISLALCAGVGLMANTASFAATKYYHAPVWHANYTSQQQVGNWSAWVDPNTQSNIPTYSWSKQHQTVRDVTIDGNKRIALVTHALGKNKHGGYYGLFRAVKAQSCQAVGNSIFKCTTK